MTDLSAKTPCDGLLPLTIGAVTVTEWLPERITSIAPFRDAALPIELPQTGRLLGDVATGIIWTGPDQYLAFNQDIPNGLQAAVTDQSDAWCCVALKGAWQDVMARLCPADCAVMRKGDVILSLVGHMKAIILRDADGVRVMVFRAFSETLVHDLKEIMTMLEGQAALDS